MDNVYSYLVPLPPKINEMVMPCEDGYTVYIADRLDREGQIKAYDHAIKHIMNNDFASVADVQILEQQRHGLTEETPVKRKLSAWEKHQKKLKRKEKALAKLGLRMERYIADDDYGCPVIKYRIVEDK